MPRIKSEFERLSLEIIENKLKDDPDTSADFKELTDFNSIWNGMVWLPEITLPNFNASYRVWLPFYNALSSLIHENKTLNNCQMFYYLKSCLKGEASRCIKSLSISDINYTSAWALLQKRYKNKRLIVQSHVKEIMNTPEIDKASCD